MVDAPLHHIGEVLVFVQFFHFSLAIVEWAERCEVLEPFAEVALIGEAEKVGYFLDGHVGVSEQVA